MSKDDFGNRMKAYEAAETERSFMPLLPIYARIDGRGFSGFTRGLDRPFDLRITRAMIETAGANFMACLRPRASRDSFR